MAIPVLKVVPLEGAESARLAAADTLKARIAVEEKAERARLAADEALETQLVAEKAFEEARVAAKEAERAWIADEERAERARQTAEETLQAWRATLIDHPETPEPLQMPPPFPEAALRAAGIGLSSSSDVEAAMHEPDPPAVEERPEPAAGELTCQIAYWRGYRKAAFYARAFDEDGSELALAESPLFKPHGKGVPEDTDEAVAAHDALIAELEADGWVAGGYDDTWFGRTFHRPPGS